MRGVRKPMVEVMSLIHEDGSLDEPAIDAEINRLVSEQEARVGWGNREFHERHVAQSVAAQQWPIIEREIAAEWTKGERRVYEDILQQASRQGIDGNGNDRHDHLLWEASKIQQVVQSRAIRKFHLRIGNAMPGFAMRCLAR